MAGGEKPTRQNSSQETSNFWCSKSVFSWKSIISTWWAALLLLKIFAVSTTLSIFLNSVNLFSNFDLRSLMNVLYWPQPTDQSRNIFNSRSFSTNFARRKSINIINSCIILSRLGLSMASKHSLRNDTMAGNHILVAFSIDFYRWTSPVSVNSYW